MNEVPDVPPAPADAQVRAPASGPVEPEEAAPESREAFDGALAEEGGLHASQAPETREAIGKSLTRFQSASAPEPAGNSETGLRQQAETEPVGTPLPPSRPGRAVETPGDPTPLAADRPEGGPAAQTRRAVAEGQLPRTVQPTGGAPRRALVADKPAPRGAANPAPRKGTQRGPKAEKTNDAGSSQDTRPRAAPATARGRSASPDTVHATVGARTPGPDTRESRHTQARTTFSSTPSTPTEVRHQTQSPASRTTAASLRDPGAAPSDTRAPSPVHGRREERRSEQVDRADAPDPAVVERTDLAASTTPVSVPETQATDAPATAHAPSTQAVEIAREVADRVLVSAPKPGAPEEVRISLNASVLDGSDIRIFREAGELRVVFVAQTESAERFLADNRAVFQQKLGERLQDERVHVEVSTNDRDGASPEDGEGRSRQQYVPQDDSSDLK